MLLLLFGPGKTNDCKEKRNSTQKVELFDFFGLGGVYKEDVAQIFEAAEKLLAFFLDFFIAEAHDGKGGVFGVRSDDFGYALVALGADDFDVGEGNGQATAGYEFFQFFAGFLVFAGNRKSTRLNSSHVRI